MSKSNIIYKVSPPPFCQSRPLANPLKRAPLIVRMGTCVHDVGKDSSVVNIMWIGRFTIFYDLWDLSVNSWGFCPLRNSIYDEVWSLLKLNDMKSYRILNEMSKSKKYPFLKFYLFNLNQLQKAITAYPTVVYKKQYNATPNVLESWGKMGDKVCNSFKDVEKKITSETQWINSHN